MTFEARLNLLLLVVSLLATPTCAIKKRVIAKPVTVIRKEVQYIRLMPWNSFRANIFISPNEDMCKEKHFGSCILLDNKEFMCLNNIILNRLAKAKSANPKPCSDCYLSAEFHTDSTYSASMSGISSSLFLSAMIDTIAVDKTCLGANSKKSLLAELKYRLLGEVSDAK